MCNAVYSEKLGENSEEEEGFSSEPFGWLCNSSVVRLPGGGCLIYSPVLGPDNSVAPIHKELASHNLLPVKVVIAPSPQHHLALAAYQKAYPDAFYLCGKGSGQMPPLTRKRRDIRFDGVLSPTSCGTGAHLGPPVLDAEGCNGLSTGPKSNEMRHLLQTTFDCLVVDDNRSGEVLLLHRATKTLLLSDLLYKSDPGVTGPGGVKNHYTTPEWFAEGQEELFYGHPQDNSGGLLPSYRTHPRLRTIDITGMRRSLKALLGWDFERATACHTDPITGDEAKRLLKTAWQWVLTER